MSPKPKPRPKPKPSKGDLADGFKGADPKVKT